MSVSTRPPRRAGSVRPDRLPRGAAPGSRRREITLGVFGVIGLLLLIVGIPVALAVFVGYPLPRSAPSSQWLTVALSATLIIKILACVVWVVWAHFVVCLLAEWRSIRRGRIPGHVALGGGSQLLARRLVAAALLLAGAATSFSQVAGPGSSGVSSSVSAIHQQVVRPAAPVGSEADSAAVRAAAAQADQAKDAPLKYYVVQPPHGRRYDSLWDIADRTLKDPLRYKEIFALNRDRTQADGRKLVDANLILPGWQLHLPADASGPGVHDSPTYAPSVRPATPALPAPTAPAAPAGSPAAEYATSVVAATTGSTFRMPVELLGGGLILAGIATALSARRGPYAPVEESVAVGADPLLAGLLDKALRGLAAARTEQGRTLPHAVLAWVSTDRVLLFHAGGDAGEPPAPWRVGVTPGSWDVEFADLADGPAPDVPAPYPGLLSIGHSADFELFVDLEQAAGLISLGGDALRARELAMALAVQAVTCRWSDGAKVTAVGFGGDDFAAISPQAVVQVPRLAEVLPDLEAEHEQVRRLQTQLGIDGVLVGRQSHRSHAWQPQLILLSGPPAPDEARRLQQLVHGRSNVSVVVVGDVASSPWRFVVDANGRIDLGALGVSATAHRLTHEAIVELAGHLRRADAGRRDRSAELGTLRPFAELAVLPQTPARAPAGVAVVATVQLLGPVAVQASGPIDDARRPLATEIVTALALHPSGISDAVLQASVWPRGVGPDVFDAAMAAVTAWLGTDSTGRPCVQRSEDGTWRLGPAVRVDWAELERLVLEPGAERELHLLTHAVEMFCGEAFSATPPGRYGWLAFARAAREARVLGTAVTRNAAAQAVAVQRSDEAERLLRLGLTLVPTAELLWRELLRLQRWDGPDGAAALAGEIYAVLRAHRSWPEPETDALIAQVAPDFHGNGPTPDAPAVAAS